MDPRITINEQSYYAPSEGDPISVGTPFSRWLKTDEQPFLRVMPVTETWKRLDTGWLHGTSRILLRNLDGKPLTCQSPVTQDSKVIEVAYMNDGGTVEEGSKWLIYPQETLNGLPEKLASFVVRCLNGPVKLSITLFPE